MERPDWLEEGELVDYLLGRTPPRWRTAVVKKISQDDDTCLIQFVKIGGDDTRTSMWVDWDRISEHKSTTYWK